MGRAFDTGSGFIACRLKIEGLPYEPVTDPAIANPGVDGCDRIVGLEGDSLAFGESIDPGTGELQVDGMTASIVEDVDHHFGDMFTRLPTKVAYLTASIVAADVTVPVSPSIFANADVIHIGTEAMLVTAGGGTASLTVTRGYRGTTAQAHFIDTTLGLPPAEITDRPAGLTGRRVELYTYEPEDSVFGLGTLRWRGICATDATQSDPARWSIIIDPPTSALDQDLSADTQDGVQPRGIAYPACARLQIWIRENTGTSLTLTGGTPVNFEFPVSGTLVFYETQAEFIAALNLAIIAATTTFTYPLTEVGPSLAAVDAPDGGWDLVFKPGATARYLSVTIHGMIDRPDDVDFTLSGGSWFSPDGAPALTVATGTQYLLGRGAGIAGAGTVPRGVLGYDPTHDIEAATIRLGGFAMPTGIAAGVIEWPAADGLGQATQYVAVTSDATARSITGTTATLYGQPVRMWTAASLPSIKLGRYYAGGNVSDFVNVILSASADGANAGRVPFLMSGDVDIVDMLAACLAIVEGRPWVATRVYATYAAANFLEILVEEMKLLGASLVLTSAGKITLREMLVRAATDPDTVTIGEAEILSGAGGEWPTFERQALGSLNTVIVKSGYNPSTDEWDGRTFRLRDLASFARQHTTRSIKIEPKSYFYLGDAAIDIADLTALAQAYFGLLGAPYSIVQARVPLTRFGVLIGDGVSVTSSVLPNPDGGGRGIVDAPGLVIGRKWELMHGIGTLRILVPHQRVAGYSPSSRIASNALVSGTTYDITLEAVQPDGYATASAWAVTDAIKVRTWDNPTVVQTTGTISAINTATRVIRVVLAAAIPAGVCNLVYGAASVATATQQRYLYVADSDRQISFAAAVPPRTLAA